MSEPRFTRALKEVGVAVVFVAIATLLTFALLHLTGPKARGYNFVFLLAIMAAAWRGYLAGLTAVFLSIFAIPFLFNPNFALRSVEPTRFLMALLISLLISAAVASRRRHEKGLRQTNEDLERRVRERTAQLEQSNRELATREEELNHTKTQLGDVLDSVSESFLAVDRDWRFTYVNRQILEDNGLNREDVIGASIWEVFPDAVDSEFFPRYQRAMKERISMKFEMFYPPSSRWLEVNVHPTREGISAFVADITQRKKGEASIARLASIVESSSDAIASKDLEGTILSWNGGAEKMYGYSAEEAVGQSMQLIVPEDRRQEEADILDGLRRGELFDHFETVRVRKDGTPIDVSLTISPIRNRDGQTTGASHVSRDVTEQKNFHAQLEQVQKLESLGVLAGGIAHDFNNLLVGILGNASLALDNALPHNHQLLREIVLAGERAADLTSQLLAYAGKGRFFIQAIDLSERVNEISTLIQTSISSSVQLNLNLAKDLLPLEADSGQIQQIVMNLVINAAEAIGPDNPGEVTVITKMVDADEQMLSSGFGNAEPRPGKYILLEVRDTGVGMSQATLARIFDPFFTTKFTGRGLGLSAVLGIVGGHRGVLKVESVPGAGTTFRILLPASLTAVMKQAPNFPATSDLCGAGDILVVDDEEIVRKVAKNCLERYGYKVLEAVDGQDALKVFAELGRIRLVLLDLTMPVMGGEEALRGLRKIREGVPVILSSGFSESEALRRFEGKGIAGFIQKPYTAARLAEKVKAALESA